MDAVDDVLIVRNSTKGEHVVQVLLCSVAVLVLAFGYDVLQAFFSSLERILPESQDKKEIREHMQAMDTIKKEMALLSPRDDFAKYFKRERQVKALREKLNQAKMVQSKRNVMINAFVTAISRVIVASIGLSLMYQTAHVKIYRFDSPDTCWPLCSIADFPRGLGVLFGRVDPYKDGAYISLFVYLNMFVRLCRRLPKLLARIAGWISADKVKAE
ncbi:hypothetical protein QR680_006250 [Steinernema hermaphroditum]|uniref:Guided entry of tail-anchored proteins factor 1 n=1 Tax=Steinernema hermaphroditum TaxID=289476 RepID=A0AA39HUW9_9BILA|nr:hypothetical protein QR680_006250 [Steinernema hermaphroditum]